MTKRAAFRAGGWIASAQLCAAWLCFASPSSAEILQIVLGTQRRVALSSDVQRVAIGDPSVTQVHLLTSRELLALGRSVGRTNVLLWTSDGRVDELNVRVERDLSALASALRDVHPRIRVSGAPDRDAIILQGLVPHARYSVAAEDMALDYLGTSQASRDGDLLVRESAASPPAESGAAGEAPGEGVAEESVYLSGDPRRGDADVVNLIRVEGLPPSLEERLAVAIAPIGGIDVRVRRLVQGLFPNDAEDTFVLQGEVRGQVELVRVLLAAAKLVSGRDVTEDSIEVLANEAGSLTAGGSRAGAPNFQIGSLGGFTNAAGSGVQSGSIGNDLSSNVARAKALSVADGRILAFVDVVDLPQVRVETRLYEVDRSRLRDWEPNLNIIYSDDTSDLTSLPLGGGIGGGDGVEPPLAEKVKAAQMLLQEGALGAGVQYVTDRIAIEATFTLLEDADIARALARPTITVLSGEVARFNAGGQIPIEVTVDTQTTAASDTLLSTTVFASFGVDVAVRPMVAEDDTITLDVSPSISRPDFALTAAITESTGESQTTTAFESRALTTTTRLRDGQSFLIAGFLQSSVSEASIFTPGLHRVPGLGWVAKSRTSQSDDTDFVIVVSPAIVRERTPRAELWAFPDPMELLGPSGDVVTAATPGT